MRLGTQYNSRNKGCHFRVWAPKCHSVSLCIKGVHQEEIPMAPENRGYFSAHLEGIQPDCKYLYKLNNTLLRPDPVSMSQPDGVHGASAVVDHSNYQWHDSTWKGLSLNQMVLYELHTGTFSNQGTFRGILSRLNALKDLGINTIELMPVAQFPGKRNWGYDGVYPYAVQQTYGGVNGLKAFVDVCHQKGLAVILDVVYNHLGPEGNYLNDYGPYFTSKYKTPWGKAINYDDNASDEVRHYVIQNARYWLQEFHIDGLRLDAVDTICDNSAYNILTELTDTLDTISTTTKIKRHLIAECDLNDTRMVQPIAQGGCGIHSQWSDDFHHALHTLLTHETFGYYQDYGRLEDFKKAYKEGFVYTGNYSPFRGHSYGSCSKKLPGQTFVVYTQNHDQVGNRPQGERLASLVDFEAQKMAAAACLLSPYLPMLFMGEEYGETNPFLYFIHHGDERLAQAVKNGRIREFKSSKVKGTPPDPRLESSFTHSILDWSKRQKGQHKTLLHFYRFLITLRKSHPALGTDKQNTQIHLLPEYSCFTLSRVTKQAGIYAFFNFSDDQQNIPFESNLKLERILDSSDKRWKGPGAITPETMQGQN
ncbi:MAG: malto-oligosyltrehalose trehalohydrolase, partial [Fibrobacteria bacterium]|nr:malto-oligosyltrehalose trehalohydrolase [Fibrobacteria bacterium]